MSEEIEVSTSLSKAELCARLERNFLNYYRRRHGMFGSVVEEDATLTLTQSPTDLCYLNRVFCVNADNEEQLKALIGKALQKFRQRHCDMLWHIGSLTRQRESVRNHIREMGAKLQNSSYGMYLLGALPVNSPPAVELEIECLSTMAKIEDWLLPFKTCFNVDGDGLEHYGECLKALLGKSCADVWFTGYVKGEPVSTAAYSIDGDVIVLYSITTLPEFRKCGYARMMTEAAINHARSHHSSELPIALYSTIMAIPFYRELGFADLYELETYLIEADSSQ
jgi:GNAT superfamily N-acetyltransferase